MSSTISKLFDSKNRKFEIPAYQRSYSWEEKQILQFIEDLKNAETQYYLGHFLFSIKENEENTLLIIDGQQRLTTCIIFFSCVKNILEFRQEKGEITTLNLEDITDYYLRDIRKETQKFKTVNYDNNFFIDEIIDGKSYHTQEPDTASKRKIRKAKEIFTNHLQNESINDIEKWCRLIEFATITEYIVDNKTQAAQVFAFQNDRGKKLSNLEVIKAYFMLQIYLFSVNEEKTEENIKYLEDEFSKIYKQIVRIKLNEDEVLNYYWRTVSGRGFYSEEVIKGIKESINTTTRDKTVWIKNFMSGLSQSFQTVEKVEKSENSYTKDLHYLNNMALAYPFIIKAYKLGEDEKCINRLIKLLENITFRYLLRGGRAEIESRLNHHLINYNNKGDVDKNINDIIGNLKNHGWWGYWNDSTMKNYLSSGYFYKNRVDNYVLWKYELYICDDNHPKPHKVSFEDLIHNESIEHIAPQTPTNGDPVANGYGIYDDKENPSNGIVSGDWLNCIGNLMLISKPHNSSIGNKPFSDKLESYGRDNLLNQQKEIGTYIESRNNPIWNKDAIKSRKAKIIAAVMDIWNLDRI